MILSTVLTFAVALPRDLTATDADVERAPSSLSTSVAAPRTDAQQKPKDKDPGTASGGQKAGESAKGKNESAAGDFEALLTATGRTRNEDGDWLTAEEQKRLKDGWTRQDLEWVSPEDVENAKQGKWKCGDKWLTLDEANEYHSKVGTWWRLRGQHFDVYSTCKRDVALEAVKETDSTFAHLERIFGRVPPMRPIVLVLNSGEQYNSFANGDGRSSPDLRGLSSAHGAFFAELWNEPFERGSYAGAGVGYLDASSDAGWSYGRTFVRHAAGQSFAEALDPSVETVATLTSKRWKPDELATAFWGEKKLPQWFRYGAAAYVERYFQDPTSRDPKSLLKWSVQNIANKGGLDPLKKVWGFEFGGDAQADAKLINECGLIVAFALDGGVASVGQKLAEVRAALKTGKNLDKALAALEDELKKNEAKLREFAGL